MFSLLNKGSIDISSMTVKTEFKDFISTLVLCMFEKLLWLIFALFVQGFPAESLKACADFRQLALMADSSLMETQHPSYIWMMKLPLTHVCIINTAWQLSLQLMSMHGWGFFSIMCYWQGSSSLYWRMWLEGLLLSFMN